jgi:glycosyltransferase involved in cell wall biosynthesis
MKIAMLSPYFNVLNHGAEQLTQKMKTEFEDKGHTMDIFNFEDYTSFTKFFEEHFSASYFGSFFKKYIGIEPSIFYARYVKQLSKKSFRDYDLLWCNSEFIVTLFCKSVRDKYNIPFIVTSNQNKSQLLKSIAKLKPDLLAVLTPEYKTFLQGIDCNVVCILPGIDTNYFKPNRKCLFDNLPKPIFLSTAALIPGKRISAIIDAVSKTNGSFVFTSDGPERKKLLKLCEEKLKGRYQYLGIVDNLPSIYNSVDYYVSASLSEGLSRSVHEAMGCNIPIVYQIDENRKLQVGDAGVGCNTFNKYDFVNALNSIQKKDFRDIPRKQAEMFDWKTTVDSYIKEIQKVLKGEINNES